MLKRDIRTSAATSFRGTEGDKLSQSIGDPADFAATLKANEVQAEAQRKELEGMVATLVAVQKTERDQLTVAQREAQDRIKKMPAEQVVKALTEKHRKASERTLNRAKPRLTAGSDSSAAIVVSDDEGESSKVATISAADRSASPATLGGGTDEPSSDANPSAGRTAGPSADVVAVPPLETPARGIKREASDLRTAAATSSAASETPSGEPPVKRTKPESG